MTRSSAKELFTPFKDPEGEFRSSRKHFKTRSLDEPRSPDFDLFSDQEEYLEEEVAETIAKTIEQYISKTRADYGSGVSSPKIEDKDNQVMLRAFPMSLTRAVSRWLRNKPSGSITTLEDLKTKFLSKYCPPTRTAKKMEEVNNFHQEPNENLYLAWERFKELLMKGAIPSKSVADVKVAIQEIAEYSQKWHNGTSRTRSTKTSNGLAAIQAQLNNLGREIKKVNEKVYAAQVGCKQGKGPHYNKDCPLKEEGKTLEEAYYTQFAKRHEENSNLIKEIRASTDAAIRNQGASIETLEIQIRQMSKVLQERGFRSLPSSTETNPRDHVKSISTTVEADASSIRCIGSHQYVTGSYGPKFSKAYSYGASHIDKSIPRKEKDPGSFTLPCFINNICFDNALADLGASVSVMPLSTYLNLGLGELAHTKLTVELADRTVKYSKGIAKNVLVCIELRRDQVDDLMPTIKEGEVVEEFRVRNDARIVSKIFGYPSDCDHDKKICIDCAHNLKFSCMIDFAVLEDMGAYRDEGMGDVIFSEMFLREVGINAKRFKGMIAIHNGNKEVTYKMVRSHTRFKHHTNEQCNKILSLLKLSKEDMINEILHSYQKLTSFYKGVLNLGPEYIRDAEMEEWLIRRHISVHEMELKEAEEKV
nr:hypothetical protein [Tanacetum cinerariifolium]